MNLERVIYPSYAGLPSLEGVILTGYTRSNFYCEGCKIDLNIVMNKNIEKLILLIIICCFFIFRLNILDATGMGSDFDYIQEESVKLSRGESIYSRILKGSLTHEEDSGGKLPVLLPSVYYFTIVFTNFGKISLQQSYDNFQYFILIADVISSLFIFTYLKKQRGLFLGFFGLIFFLFNRWSTNAFFGGYFDPVALMFLIISLYFLGKRNYTSAIFLSLSILFKHFGLFVLPVYLIFWLNKNGVKTTVKYMLTVLVPVIITIIPSALVDFKGFFYSIMLIILF